MLSTKNTGTRLEDMNEEGFVLEELQLDDLENVIGGSIGTTVTDSHFLNEVGLCPDRFGKAGATINWGRDSEMVDNAWRRGGVTCVTRPLGNNTYMVDSKVVSQVEAYQYVCNKLGKTVDIDKYLGPPIEF